MTKIRKAHVKRIHAKDDQGNDDPDVWYDVLRLDVIGMSERGFPSGVTEFSKIIFSWKDGPRDDDKEDNNPARETEDFIIKNPESPDDTSQQVTLKIIKSLKIRLPAMRAETGGYSGQIIKMVFANDDQNDQRKVDVARIVSVDLGKDASGNDFDMTDPVDWEVYQAQYKQQINFNEGSQTRPPTDGNPNVDKDQYIDVEIVRRFKVNFGAQLNGIRNQGITWVLDNAPLTNLLDDGGAGRDSSGNKIDPDRLDPLQIIVNLSVGGLAVEFNDHIDGSST